jgi:flagellar export protein FliJ
MPAFRFRAQAALDLRQRELDAAQRELARTQRDLATARQRLGDAEAACRRASDETTARMREPATSTQLHWYQSWILRLDHERKACAATVAARDLAVATAANACMHAKRRCESLERLRTRAQQTHEAAEAAADRKLIDELATRRHAAERAEGAEA